MLPKTLKSQLSFLLLSGACSLLAMDRVQIRTHGSHPPLVENDASVSLSVSRNGSNPSSRAVEVDRYFDQVETILFKNKATEDWGYILDPNSYVEIEVVINQRRNHLACTYGPEGVALPPNPTPAHKQFAAAFQEVLSLTLDRVHARLSAK